MGQINIKLSELPKASDACAEHLPSPFRYIFPHLLACLVKKMANKREMMSVR
jgi:hypothetical protein